MKIKHDASISEALAILNDNEFILDKLEFMLSSVLIMLLLISYD